MKIRVTLIRLAAFAIGLSVGLPCLAETPEQIEQRLEDLRRMDAEATRRRQETLEFQARRKLEEYARRWKRYGDEEIDVLKWRQQKDGTWVTEVKNVSAQGHINSLLPVQDRAVVRFGDTVVKIAQRYGLTLQELLQLNPGLETARLVVGSYVRLAQSSSSRTGMVLGLKPSTSGGVSWPELPRFDSSLDALVREGVVAPAERDRILGIRMTDSLIGVSCTSLMVNRKPSDERWGFWTRPEKGSADEQLIIDRCTTRREGS